MARLRTIKPTFFLDEDLAECHPLSRLLFAGLWCIADREGRLEDRPRRIKVEVLPYDDCDVDVLLNELASKSFIVRYVIDGRSLIAIPKWAKHQQPHYKEVASVLPPPPDYVVPRIADALPAPTTPDPGRLELTAPSLPELAAPRIDLKADFVEWWEAYGKVGSMAECLDLYKWWRTTGRAGREELLAAAKGYRRHCEETDCKMQHGRTFLAKATKTKSARWPEWAAGIDHGSMDPGDAPPPPPPEWTCPKCGSNNVAGRVGEGCLCMECEHQWRDGL